MQKVDELEKEGKHRDAYMKIPSINEYPEREEAIRKRQSSLSAKFAPDLFADAVPTAPTTESTEVYEERLFPEYSSDDVEEELDDEYAEKDEEY